MSQTPTLPLEDPKMWRRLLSRTHPDAGGDHELFIWTGAVRDKVCSWIESSPRSESSSRNGAPGNDTPRVPFYPGCDFASLTGRALRHEAGDYGRILSLLSDCQALADLAHEQRRGASYRRLAAIGHLYPRGPAYDVHKCRDQG